MSRGSMRIYLGAAPGVGKTFAMLAEGRRRWQRGTDVVVGLATSHGRPGTEELLAGLEVVPARHVVDSRGDVHDELDVHAVLARAPAVVLVDDLAAANVPDSATGDAAPLPARWQEVDRLLDAGIDVITTMNVQQLESLRDVVARIAGTPARETVPDAFVRGAAQIELLDMTPEAIRRRLAHGHIYPPERVDATVNNAFRLGTLGAFRELALRWVADRVEDTLIGYQDANQIADTWETRERVVVSVTGAPGADAVVRRAARIARRSHGDLIGVHVTAGSGLAEARDGVLSANRELLERLGGLYHEVVGTDVAQALAAFAEAERATQLVIGNSHRSRWQELRSGSVVDATVRAVRDVDVHVIATRAPAAPAGLPRPRQHQLPRRRMAIAWVLAAVGLPLVTVLGIPLRDHVDQSVPLLAYLLLVSVVAAIGGAIPGFASAAASSLVANWYFTPPLHRLTIGASEDVVALVVFVSVAAIIAALVGANARGSAEAGRVRAEAEALARSTGTLVGEQDPLPGLLAQLQSTFSLDAAAVLRGHGDGWQRVASVGDGAPRDPEDGEAITIDAGNVLVLVGGPLVAEDRRLLAAFAAQLGAALTSRRLQAEAAQASLLAAANDLRSALLQSVSHDLRTPLASIKVAASSLLQPDVRFGPAEQLDLLHTIDDGADRLDRLIANLLDMSRLQSGALRPDCVPTIAEDAVVAALGEIAGSAPRVDVAIDPDVPAVRADPVLLERALVNLLANALSWSPPDQLVRVGASHRGASVSIRIADRGPGIPVELRPLVFAPFQRLGDRSSQAGVGLGLAVARGFVTAMDGELELEDTPGGGLTAVLTLPAVR
jgi:two-component system sensor histidine kinase KdpD